MKVWVAPTAIALVAAGTGISLAASSDSGSVLCIVEADAKAAVDAGTAISDTFAVGTKLHMTSAGRQVDVTVSGPLTAPPANGGNAAGNAGGNAGGDAAGNAGAANTGTGRHRRHRNQAAANAAADANAAAKTSTAKTSTARTSAAKTSTKARVLAADPNAPNLGVDPNSTCVKIAKNAFNTLSGSGNGNNVGTFIATMTPVADGAAQTQ
jgi:hypothetical protein